MFVKLSARLGIAGKARDSVVGNEEPKQIAASCIILIRTVPGYLFT